jgi:ATP-dependent Clp protease ATP-binding subunit ClpC
LFGRERELRALTRVLLRKTKNNPLVVGPAGVGKTALVEGLAGLAARSEAPWGETDLGLSSLRVVEIAPARLTMGTLYRGTLEAKLEALLSEVSTDPDLVLFVDEIHSLVRAGAIEGGALDIANILKPALARGELRCIGATTPDEFDRFLKADPAFERRFEPVFLDEPTQAEAIQILAAAKGGYEAHHQVEILPEAVEAAVQLSAAYLLDRSLPDKAFDLLDNACTLSRLPPAGPELSTGEVRVVDREIVALALSEKLNIPVQKLSDDQRRQLAGLDEFLRERILGQPWAVGRTAAAVRRAFSGLGSPDRPRGVLAFFGSSGTGKTATAQALAEFLCGSPEAMIRLDLAEFKEAHSVARLAGAPPGYVGYTDEGTFASRLRRQPFAVVLLDEFEKAHPQVLDAFLQVFDQGRFTDARGRQVDARQALFVLTSNLFTLGEIASGDVAEAQAEAVRAQLAALFRPEFTNRIDEIVLFGALDVPALIAIAAREIAALNLRLARYDVRVQASPDVLRRLAESSLDPNSGARSVLRAIARQVAEPVGAALLRGELRSGEVFEVEALS